MSTYWARIENGKVTSVVVGEDDTEEAQNWLSDNLEGSWVQTFLDGTRGNYAGIGFTYDEELDAFIPPKPSEDAVLDEATFSWVVDHDEEEKEEADA